MPHGDARQWLEKNKRAVQWYDNAQDTYLSGAHHFVNLENPENDSQPSVFSHHAVQSWSVLGHLLTPFNASRQKQQWAIQPLTESQLPSGPTVYDAVVEKYNKAVGAMIKYQLASSTLTPLQKEKHSGEMAKHIGAMNHYLADLYMPLHASRWYNWPVAPDKDGKRHPEMMQGIHQFIEQEMFTREELLSVMQQAPKNNALLKLKREQLKPFLLKQIEHSHLMVYQLFDANKTFWKENPDLHQNPQAYKDGLSRIIKPMIEKRMAQAQQGVGSVLHLAWQDASRVVEQYMAMAERQKAVMSHQGATITSNHSENENSSVLGTSPNPFSVN